MISDVRQTSDEKIYTYSDMFGSLREFISLTSYWEVDHKIIHWKIESAKKDLYGNCDWMLKVTLGIEGCFGCQRIWRFLSCILHIHFVYGQTIPELSIVEYLIFYLMKHVSLLVNNYYDSIKIFHGQIYKNLSFVTINIHRKSIWFNYMNYVTVLRQVETNGF